MLCMAVQGLETGLVRPEDVDEMAPLKQFIFDQRWLVRQLVEDTRFNQAFLGITILNTFFLALFYDGTHHTIKQLCFHVKCVAGCQNLGWFVHTR